MTAPDSFALSEFEKMRLEIIALYDQKKMRATGAAAESLEVFSSEGPAGGVYGLLGNSYFQQLETGRRPGPVSKEGQENLKDWILAKGVFASAIAEIGINSLAFLIARKIKEKGYDRAAYGGVELISTIVTPQRIQLIINQEGALIATRYASDIMTMLEAISLRKN